MAFNPGAGGNPRFGRDPGGSLPPGSGFDPLQQYRPYGFPPVLGGPARYAPGFPQQPGPVPYGMPMPMPQLPGYPLLYAPPGAAQQPPQPAAAAAAAGGPGPAAQPLRDQDFRTCNMRNSTGGYGCEPGYNYFFPSEHTKIHVLKTGSTPPWQLPANFRIQFHACHVPVNTTVADLLKGFGARNAVPKKNVITEVCQGGGGKWYRGIELRGDDVPTLKKTLDEFGWDASRTGLRGQKKVVYVYVQRD